MYIQIKVSIEVSLDVLTALILYLMVILPCNEEHGTDRDLHTLNISRLFSRVILNKR